MVTTPRRFVTRLYIGVLLLGAIVFGLLSLFIAFKVVRGGGSVVPDKASLQLVSGRLVAHSVVDHRGRSTHGGANKHIHITLESLGAKRELTLREEPAVWNALCDGCNMVLWINDEKIWQFSVSGKIIRSYEGERQHYIDLYKETGPRDILLTVLPSIFSFAAAYFLWRRQGASGIGPVEWGTTGLLGKPVGLSAERQERKKDWPLASGGEAAMTDLEPTGIRLAKIWWFMVWRGLLGGLLIGYGAELVLIALLNAFQGGFDKQTVPEITNFTIPLILMPIAIFWSGYALRMAFAKKFADFRIALQPLASVADSGSLEPTWVRLAKIWWFMVWRGLLGGLLIGCAVLFFVAFFVGASGVNKEMSDQLKAVTKYFVFPSVVFLWIGYAIRMALRKKFADFRIALLPLAS